MRAFEIKSKQNNYIKITFSMIFAFLISCSSATDNPTYRITYDGNGNTSGEVPVDNKKYHSGDKVTVLGNTGNLIKTGNYLYAWQDEDNSYHEPHSTFNISEDTTLKAIWSKSFDYGDYKCIILPDNTVEIVGLVGTPATCVIPEKIDDFTVSSIGHSVFEFKSSGNPSSVIIPNTVTNIGYRAFFLYHGTITISDSIKTVGEMAFYQSTLYKIPSGLTTIGDHAYAFCHQLTDVTIPEGVTVIPTYAFYGCSKIASVTLPDNLQSIAVGAFAGCNLITSINIPASVTNIGVAVFSQCDNLSSITVDPANSSYKDEDGVLFNKSGLILMYYPAGKTSSNYIIPSGVITIEDYAFGLCTKLTSISIANSVKYINSHAFWDCTGLTSITIPDNVETIGEAAFFGCSGLTDITFPASVTKIGIQAFSNCSELSAVSIPATITIIDAGAFSSCAKLTSITVDSGNVNYKDIEGVLLSKDGSTLLTYPCYKSGTNYDIPDAVTNINKYAFMGVRTLTSLKIPSGVVNIGTYAFGYCNKLISITIMTNTPPVLERNDVFYETSSLTNIYVPSASVTSYQSAYIWSDLASKIGSL